MSLKTAAGTNYWEMVKANSLVQSGRPFTLMAWVNQTTVATTWACIASTYDGTANSWELGTRSGNGSNGWYFTWSNGGNYYGDNAALGGVLVANVWYHLCVRYGLNGAAATTYDMVQDGNIVATAAAQGAPIVPSQSRKLRIHQSSDNAGVGMPGQTACIRMFDGILPLADVSRCRVALVVPQNLRSRLICDIPGVGRTDAGIPFDTGPNYLGAFTKTGTVTVGFEPPAYSRPNKWLRFPVLVSGGPTNYTRLVTDNLAVSDSTSRYADSFRVVSNSLGLTDAAARSVASLRPLSDTLGLSDTAARIASSKRLVSETVGLSDSTARIAPALRLVSDSVALSDVVARVAPSMRVVSDNAAVTDTMARLATSFRVVSDLLGITDAASRKAPSLRVVSDSVGLSDSASRLASHFRLISDFVAIGDTTTVLLIQTGTLLIIARDNLGISDAVSRIAASFRAVSDTLALADACSRAVTSRRLVSDHAAVADAAAQKTTALRLATDSLGLSDVVVRVVSYRRLVSDTLALLDLARITTGTRPFSNYPAGIWQATGASDASLSCGTITLKTNCERFLAMNFRTQPELMYGGLTISTVTLTISPVGLDASPVSNNSTMAGAWFTASVIGTYAIKFSCLLSDGITRIVRTGLCEVVS